MLTKITDNFYFDVEKIEGLFVTNEITINPKEPNQPTGICRYYIRTSCYELQITDSVFNALKELIGEDIYASN